MQLLLLDSKIKSRKIKQMKIHHRALLEQTIKIYDVDCEMLLFDLVEWKNGAQRRRILILY